MTSIWTTQQPAMRVQWGTRPSEPNDAVGALRKTLAVLACCGAPFAGPWKLLDPSSEEADGAFVGDLTDDEVSLLIHRGVTRNADGQPFPRDGYSVSLVGKLVGSVGASMRLHVGATVSEYIVNEVAVRSGRCSPGRRWISGRATVSTTARSFGDSSSSGVPTWRR